MTKGRLNRRSVILLITLLATLNATLTAAASLPEQARDFVAEQLQDIIQTGDTLEIHVNPIDRRIRLNPCREVISFEPTRALQPGRFSLKASCRQPQRWSLYINGRITLLRDVVVSSRALPKHSILSRDMLALMKREISSLRQGYYTNPDQIEGHRLKRAIKQQQLLTPRLVNPPLMVRKDEQVIISAGAGRLLQVRVAGIALQDGRMDQQIRVRNLNSGKVIKARVTAAGQVHAGR